MTDISEIFTPATTSFDPTPTYTNTSDEDIMGKEDFLTLLVAQLQNQDPLNPDDATEFTSQLAEFSSLEQLQNLNKSMESLAATQVESDRFASMELIGKDVVYADSRFSFEGDPVNVGYQLDGPAASITMYIQDENGSTVATLHPTEMGQGDHFLEWDGLDSEGNEVPAGNYKIILQASSAGDDTSIAVSPLVQSEVTGVNFSNDTGEAIIHTLAGAEITGNSIIAVYQSDRTYNTSPTTSTEEVPIVEGVVNKLINDVTGTSTSQPTEESGLTDAEQIEQDLLQHYLVG
jgi:flagellar basal-body rod modification protein FlgD